MDTLTVTIVGQDLFPMLEEKFKLVGLNQPSQVNHGMLGNLKTLTDTYEINKEDIIEVRKNLLQKIGEEPMRMKAFFAAGDWMKILVVKPFKAL